MYCQNCGSSAVPRAMFCGSCGEQLKTKKISKLPSKAEEKLQSGEVDSTTTTTMRDVLLYSKSWARTKIVPFAAIPHFDILVMGDFLYLVKLPNTYASTVLAIIGLTIFRIVGLIIGWFLGNQLEERKREKFRSSWLTTEGKLSSNQYEKSIFLKIPKDELSGSIVFAKSRLITITYKGATLTLRKYQKERDRVMEYLHSYMPSSK